MTFHSSVYQPSAAFRLLHNVVVSLRNSSGRLTCLLGNLSGFPYDSIIQFLIFPSDHGTVADSRLSVSWKALVFFRLFLAPRDGGLFGLFTFVDHGSPLQAVLRLVLADFMFLSRQSLKRFR